MSPTIDWNKYFDKTNWHPLANLFPVMTEEEIADLASDITKNGLEEPIVLHENKVLDGRNRLLAIELAGLPLSKEHFVKWFCGDPQPCGGVALHWVVSNGDSSDFGKSKWTPLSWVVSKNLHRRHLTTSQRAAIAVEMESLFAEEAKKRQATSTGGKVPQLKANLPDAATGQARDKAAAAMQVSPRSVQDAKKLKKEDLKAFEQVKAGETTLHRALSNREQRRIALLEKFPEHNGKSASELENIARKKIAAGQMEDPGRVKAVENQVRYEFANALSNAKENWNRNELIIRKMADACCESGALIAWLDDVIKVQGTLEPERVYNLQKSLREAAEVATKYANMLVVHEAVPQTKDSKGEAA